MRNWWKNLRKSWWKVGEKTCGKVGNATCSNMDGWKSSSFTRVFHEICTEFYTEKNAKISSVIYGVLHGFHIAYYY